MGGSYEANTALPRHGNPESSAGPALEGRFEFWHKFGEHTRIELAPGFHTAQTAENGISVPSRLFSFDWFANPWEKIEFTGAFYRGENIAGLGTIGPGYFIEGPMLVRPVQSIGGWAQLAWLATPKLTFHLIAGQHNNQASEVSDGLIDKNQGYAANLVYRLAPNVLFSLEGMQLRTSYVGSGTRLNNHYDLGVAYLFYYIAQNAVRRGGAPDLLEGARRTLCAPNEIAQNGVRHQPLPSVTARFRRSASQAGWSSLF